MGHKQQGQRSFAFSPSRVEEFTVRALTRLGESVWMRLGTSQPPHIALERGRMAIDVETGGSECRVRELKAGIAAARQGRRESLRRRRDR